MPDVVFEINGRKYPLPPSAYTSTVGALGRGNLGSPSPTPSWQVSWKVVCRRSS